MASFPRLRFSLGSIMVLVLMAAVATALFFRVRHLLAPTGGSDWPTDAPAVLVIAIGLTALAIGSIRGHGLIPIMLQVSICCGLLLALLWMLEPKLRIARYWFQMCFAATVVLPLWIRRFAAPGMEAGPRKDRLMGTLELLLCSFTNLILILIGILLQVPLLELIF